MITNARLLSLLLLCSACQREEPQKSSTSQEVPALLEATPSNGPSSPHSFQEQEVLPLPLNPGEPAVIKSYESPASSTPTQEPPPSGISDTNLSASNISISSSGDQSSSDAMIQQSIDVSKLSQESTQQMESFEAAGKKAQEEGKQLLQDQPATFINSQSDFLQSTPAQSTFLNPNQSSL